VMCTACAAIAVKHASRLPCSPTGWRLKQFPMDLLPNRKGLL
jgi:hypothetical protein